MRRHRRVIPGFGLSLGYTTAYLSLVVLIPLGALVLQSTKIGWEKFWHTITLPEIMSAYWVSASSSLAAALIDAPLGFLVAWVLVRYNFPGRRVVDAVIDLPFALPTAVAGVTLAQLYGPHGWIGHALDQIHLNYPWIVWRGFEHRWWPLGVQWFTQITRTPLGVVVALMFVGLPFIVRTIQPVMQGMNRELEEAAESLGATRGQTFRRVIFPQLTPALITGVALAFARGLGEYGSVIFIAGTNQRYTDIAPREIIAMMDAWDYDEAAAVAMVMLVLSLAMLIVINLLQRNMAKKAGEEIER